MAEVYKAYHPGLDRYVAVKVLHSFLAEEENFLTRFQREARIVATFRHPNIVQVYDFDFDAESKAYYMVMEFLDGPSLKTRLQEMAQQEQVLPLEEAIHIGIAVANALDYAHRQGMVHRDIKPANIIFTQDGQAILSDFGIAKIINSSTLTASGAMIGTPAYMAPEQGTGRAGDERADIYSLGVVLYQLVTGSLPFGADTPLGVILKHINTPLTPPTTLNPDLPPDIEAVVTRALAKDPNNRYQTARELADDLEKCMAGEPVEPMLPEPTMAQAAPDAADQASQLAWPTLVGAPATPLPQATPADRSKAARPKRGLVAVLAAVLALVLLGSAVIFATGAPGRLLTALLSRAATPTPGVTGTPTSTPTPDMTATYDFLTTQVAAGVDAALSTRDALATINVSPTSTPTPTPTPASTPTPDLTATTIAACVFDMEIINDRTVWPSVLMPGQQFVKRWTIKNTGTCTWPKDVQLIFTSGDELEITREVEIEPLSPGETAEVRITLRAPAAYKQYTSVWELQDGEGNPIGEKLMATCRVGSTPTPRPTATPTATPTPEFTPTPTEPFHFSVPIVVTWREIPGQGKWEAQVGLTAWGGEGNYRYYLNYISDETEFFNGSFDIEATNCKSWWGTVIVTSGEEVQEWEGEISYPDPDQCN